MERKLTKTCTIVTYTFFLLCFQQLKNDLTKRISLREVVCDLKTFATISDLRFLRLKCSLYFLLAKLAGIKSWKFCFSFQLLFLI